MRIVADTDRCVGAGQCVLTDPAIFDQSEEDGTVRTAAGICPSQALSLAED